MPNLAPPLAVQASLNMGWAILNAAGLNFVAFNHYTTTGIQGGLFTVFIIVLAAAEAAVALAIVLAIYQNLRDIDANRLDTLQR